MSQKIGVFGGTFDPPHVGHLSAARAAAHELALDRVLFVVAHQPWQKVGSRRITPSSVRLAMVTAALEDVDEAEVSTIEIDRGGDSYTIDTLTTLLDETPDAELFLIVGTDVAGSLDTWHRSTEVQQLCTLAIVGRPGSEDVEVPDGWKTEWVDAPMVHLSSTDLRRRLHDGRPVRFLVPDAVIDLWHSHFGQPKASGS